jgi:hypothetical protein
MKTPTPWYIKAWRYLSHLWQGNDNRISLKRVLAIYFSYDAQDNISFAVKKWSEGRSMEGLYLVVGLEVALIAALLGATSFFNYKERQLSSTSTELPKEGGME